MSRVKCPRCDTVLAAPRGMGRMRFVPLKIMTVRALSDGAQCLDTICPGCRADVSIPLPLEALTGQPSMASLRQAAAEMP